VTLATGFALLSAGCGGGGSNFSNSNQQTTQRFAGAYSGAFVAVGTVSGDDLAGTFNAAANKDGAVSGTILQEGGFPPVPASGTIANSGALDIRAKIIVPITPPATISTVISGNATVDNGDSVLTGTTLTTQSGSGSRGRLVGIRTSTSNSPFAGTYSGSFNGKITTGGTTFNGTLAMTVNANGLIRGTFTRTATGVRVRPLIGTIDRAGNAQLFALAEVAVPAGSQNFQLVTNQLTGKATTSNGVKISGALNRTGDASINATGTFTATRTSTAT